MDYQLARSLNAFRPTNRNLPFDDRELLHQTRRADVIDWIGAENYDDNRTPCQNFVRFCLNGGVFLTSETMHIRGWRLSFDGEEQRELRLPGNVELENCSLVSEGIIHFYQGELSASVRNAVVHAHEMAEAIASVAGAEAHAHDRATASATAYAAKAIGQSANSIVLGRCRGAIVQQFGRDEYVLMVPNMNHIYPVMMGRPYPPRFNVIDAERIRESLNVLNEQRDNFFTTNTSRDIQEITNRLHARWMSSISELDTTLSLNILPSSLSTVDDNLHINIERLQSIRETFQSQFTSLNLNTTTQSEETIQTYWFKQADIPIGDLNEKWAALETTKNRKQFAEFKTLLMRLSQFDLKDKVSASEVVDVIRAVIESPSVAALIFEASETAGQDCGERPLTIFNTIQGLALFGTREAQGATPQELLDLAKGIARQTLLEEATVHVMKKQWEEGRLVGNDPTGNSRGTGPNTKEALEYQMALRHALGETLDLPFPVKSVYNATYIEIGVDLTHDDKLLAIDHVIHTMSDEKRLVETLVSLPVWNQYMTKMCERRKGVIDNDFGEQMGQIDDEMMEGKKSEKEYLDVSQKLKNELDVSIDDLIKSKTRELCFPSTALADYHELDAQNNPVAAHYLGFVHENGIGVPVDHVKALGYYVKAVERGSQEAADKILAMCLDGRAEKINLKLTVEYLNKAAQQGNEQAAKKLEQMGLKASFAKLFI